MEGFSMKNNFRLSSDYARNPMLFTEVDAWRESQKFWRRCGQKVRNVVAGIVLAVSATLLLGTRVWLPIQEQSKFAPILPIELILLVFAASLTVVKILVWTLEAHKLLRRDK